MKNKIFGLSILVGLLLVAFYIGRRYESGKWDIINDSRPMNDTGESIFDLKVKALGKVIPMPTILCK